MSRALLAIALALSLGNPAAVLSWSEALFELVLPMAGEAGSRWDPDGVDAGGLGAPAGTDGDSDAGSKWDPDG